MECELSALLRWQPQLFFSPPSEITVLSCLYVNTSFSIIPSKRRKFLHIYLNVYPFFFGVYKLPCAFLSLYILFHTFSFASRGSATGCRPFSARCQVTTSLMKDQTPKCSELSCAEASSYIFPFICILFLQVRAARLGSGRNRTRPISVFDWHKARLPWSSQCCNWI